MDNPDIDKLIIEIFVYESLKILESLEQVVMKSEKRNEFLEE
jgi:hypothetical protein